MANLNGSASCPVTEPEEISCLLHQLLHNSSAAAKLMPHSFCSSHLGTASATEMFSDPDCHFARESENAPSFFETKYRRDGYEENELGDFSCDSEGAGASDMPFNATRPRNSSKRTRAAEVHNLSEKRRRSRINEKMKALQNLIPNSNKTDKASMLDEAIEYLKQLQLQVQMLTMRNALTLRPSSVPAILHHPMQLPLAGMSFQEGNGMLNNNTLAGTFSAGQENLLPTAQCPPPPPPRTGTNMSSRGLAEPHILIHHLPFATPTSKVTNY